MPTLRTLSSTGVPVLAVDRPAISMAARMATTGAGTTSPTGAAVERFTRCPVGDDIRLIASMAWSAVTTSRHLPVPSPRRPARVQPLAERPRLQLLRR